MKRFRHKKSLGQHFLKSNTIINKIIENAELKKDDFVWEVGTGKGILTEELIKSKAEILSFEIDKRLYTFLNKKFADVDNLQIVKDDIMKANWEQFYHPEKRIKVVANLPYQITSPFLFKIVDNIEHFESVYIMIQKEVAERIVAKPGTKAYGRLSVKLQYFFNPEYLFTVPPKMFTPPPKVDSAVIKLTERKDRPEIKNISYFWNLINCGFLNRRKMLRRNLRSLINKETIAEITQDCPIDLKRRGETLSEEEFITLYNYLFSYFSTTSRK